MQFKKIITAYPERIILVIAFIGLIIHGIKTFNAPPDPDVERIKGKFAKIKNMPNQPLVFPEVKHLETIKSKWDKLPSVPEMYNGMMYRGTIPLISYTITAVAPKMVILAPVMGQITVDPEIPDRIVITWTKNTKVPLTPLAGISGYRIYRRVAGEKEDKVLTEIKAESITSTEFSYTDTNEILPELQYTYYITALTNEKPEEMTDGKTESIPSAAKQITTPEIVRLNAEVAYPDRVFMSIEKYIDGKWQKSRDYFGKGEKVGKGKFGTEYVISAITEETRNKVIDAATGKVIVQKFFKIVLKHAKTGKEIVRETTPVTQ